MDTTLRYVQQFGRSKRDNLKPSLLNKYQVGQTIEVYPFRLMDFGTFASTPDGLSGLLHNSEMPSSIQSSLQEMIDQQQPITVRINKYDRRSGEVAFTVPKEKDAATEAAVEAAKTTALADAAPTVTVTETPVADASTEATAEVIAEEKAEPKVETKAEPKSTGIEPHQFTTPQPSIEPASDTLSARLNREMADIQKFLENVLQQPLSEPAKKLLLTLLQQHSIFRFTYTMQTVVDDFEPDLGLQLISAISRLLNDK